MSFVSIIASNYAKALFNVIKKDGFSFDQALEESVSLRQLLIREVKLKIFLEGPQFREEDKEELVNKVFKGRIPVLFYRFILLLLRRNRIEHLLPILDCFETLVEEEKGIVSGVVITAIPLNQEEQIHLQRKLEHFCNQRFLFRFTVDPGIIGGVKVKFADVLLDTSIATYLGDLRMRLQSIRLAS